MLVESSYSSNHSWLITDTSSFVFFLRKALSVKSKKILGVDDFEL
jgi:hypothetical protein